MNGQTRRGAGGGLLAWLFLLLLGPPTAALLYAFWPYPKARGMPRLVANVQAEYALLHRLEPEAIRRAQRVDAALHELLFRRTGLETLLHPPPGARDGSTPRLRGLSDFPLVLRYSLRLSALRVGVLLGVLPLVLALSLHAIIDGATARRLRRLRAARESSFLYHRYKLTLFCSLWGLAACYLLPPIILDPRWIIPPFVIAFSATLRMTTACFKKYL